MKSIRKYSLFLLVIFLIVLLSACGGAAEPEANEPAANEPVANEPEMEMPTEVKIGVVVAGTLEEPWYSTSIDSLEKLKESNPYDVDIQIDYTENIWGEDSLRVMSEYAEAGYDIVWSLTGADSEYIAQIQDQYPDVLFAHSGGGGTALGKNSVHVWGILHEPTYLMGMIAGMMTESNVIGMIGSFPSEEVNAEVNAYIQGAKDVNPDTEVKITFINSWYDPDKTKESAVAQIASSADVIYPTIFGAFDAMEEAGIYGFGNYVDQSSMAPDVILASTVLSWDNSSAYLLKVWYEHATTGNPYNEPAEPVINMMSNGAGGIAYNEDLIPADVLTAVKAKEADIMSGEFVVPMNMDVPESD